MRCIFCKAESSETNSVEHIIPESLGNKDHVLKNGIVCDKCNNYFSSKIEQPVLSQPYFVSVRHRNFIESKKNKIPLERAFIGRDSEIYIDVNSGDRSIIIENSETVNKILKGEVGHMIIPAHDMPEPNNYDLSRFLGKIAIEVLAQKFCHNEEWLNEITDKPELDELRRYVRIGDKPKSWEYHQRRLYNESDLFHNPKIQEEPYEILHEFILLYTEQMEMYLVIVIMGIEYAINFANPKIEGYKTWLEQNNHVSPLFDSNERRIVQKPEKLWNIGDKMNFYKKL